MDLCIERKTCIFVKLYLKSVIDIIDIDTTDCNDTGSLEACIWKNKANLPVFVDFLLSLSPLSKQDTNDSSNTSFFFYIPYWVDIQWPSIDNILFFDF